MQSVPSQSEPTHVELDEDYFERKENQRDGKANKTFNLNDATSKDYTLPQVHSVDQTFFVDREESR